MAFIGLRNFLLVVKVNSIVNFSDNHFVILDPFDDRIYKKTSRIIGTLSLSNGENISNYSFYRLDSDNMLTLVNDLYRPTPNEILILLNNSIELVIQSRINEFIVRYLNQYNIKRFLDNSTQVTIEDFDPLDEFN